MRTNKTNSTVDGICRVGKNCLGKPALRNYEHYAGYDESYKRD